jgi:hypothetical protein
MTSATRARRLDQASNIFVSKATTTAVAKAIQSLMAPLLLSTALDPSTSRFLRGSSDRAFLAPKMALMEEQPFAARGPSLEF